MQRDVLKLLHAIPPQNGLRDVASRGISYDVATTLGIKGRCAYVQLGEIILRQRAKRTRLFPSGNLQYALRTKEITRLSH